jgi:hypothetical protein
MVLRVRGSRVATFQLFGINGAGETAFTQLLRTSDQEAVHAIARERLSEWPVVEVWEGPVCLLRLRRSPEP